MSHLPFFPSRDVDLRLTVKYLPAWFPGAEFKRQAAEWKRLVDAMHMRPYEVAKAAYVRFCLSLAYHSSISD